MLILFKDRLLNLKKRCGLIYNKIWYLKYRKTSFKSKKKGAKQTTTDENENAVLNDQSDDGTDELEFLLYFKSCLVDRDIEILKIKLTQTIDMREKLIKKKGIDFHKTFPFYFIQPTLVSTFNE